MLALDPVAVQWSAPERARAGRPLLVLAHGRGADERDLFALSPYLPLRPVIASVRAPIPEGPGWSWYETPSGGPAEERRVGADAGAVALLDWLGGVDTSAGVGILGFSQGAVVAIQALRRAPRTFDWIVGLSGYLAAGEHEGDALLSESPTPVFWARGAEDALVTPRLAEAGLPWLREHTALTERVYPALAHEVSRGELRDVSAWIADRLAPTASA